MASILVIEDDDALRHLLRLVLEREGHQVRCAAAGTEGLELQRTQPADLVICDLSLPGEDGLKVIEQLRGLSAVVRVIATSGASSACGPLVDFPAQARARGAAVVLRKPFSLPALASAVETALAS